MSLYKLSTSIGIVVIGEFNLSDYSPLSCFQRGFFSESDMRSIGGTLEVTPTMIKYSFQEMDLVVEKTRCQLLSKSNNRLTQLPEYMVKLLQFNRVNKISAVGINFDTLFSFNKVMSDSVTFRQYLSPNNFFYPLLKNPEVVSMTLMEDIDLNYGVKKTVTVKKAFLKSNNGAPLYTLNVNNHRQFANSAIDDVFPFIQQTELLFGQFIEDFSKFNKMIYGF